MLRAEEGQRFEQIIEDFDIGTSNMMGTYDFYQVMGLPAFSKYSEKNFQDRFEYLTIECKFRKNVLDAGLACISAAKTILNKEQLKNNYDDKLRRKFKNQSRLDVASNNKVLSLEKKVVSLLDNIEKKEFIIRQLNIDIRESENKIDRLDDTNRSHINSIRSLKSTIETLKDDIRKKNVKFRISIIALSGLIALAIYQQVYFHKITSQTDQTSVIRTNYGWITIGTAKIYIKPNNKSNIIAELSAGTQLHAIDETNYFIKIDFTYNGRVSSTGYVMKSILTKTQ